MIKCPLRYTGNKYKLLPQILPLFPNNINTFVDLFAGSYTVGINVNAKKYICNDMITYIIEFYEFLKNNDINLITESIDTVIDTYKLSKTNLEGYNSLREIYNQTKFPLFLFILSCFSFNHQIRFNSNGEYNMPVGKRDFNSSSRKNIKEFSLKLKNKNILFHNESFDKIDYSNFENPFFYYYDFSLYLPNLYFINKIGLSLLKDMCYNVM